MKRCCAIREAGGNFRTHDYAPRVLLCNSNLVGPMGQLDKFNELDRAGLTMYGQMTREAGFISGRRGFCRGRTRRSRAAAKKHFGGDLAGKLVVSGGNGRQWAGRSAARR